MIVRCLCGVVPQEWYWLALHGARESGKWGDDVGIARDKPGRLDEDAQCAAQLW